MHVMLKLAKALLYAKGIHLGELDGYERLIAGIYGRPDCVPVILQPYLYAMHLNGLRSRKFFSEAVPFVHASYNTAMYFGADSWTPVFDFYDIEAEALGQEFIWDVQLEPSVNKHNFLLKEKGLLLKLKPPIPGESGRMPFVLESYRLYRGIMHLPPICYACSPFTLAILVRGLQEFLMDMMDDPSFAHDLMEFLSMEVVAPWIRTLIRETGTSMVAMSDAQASPPIVSPDMINEFCLPYIEKIIRATSTPQCTVGDTGTWGESKVKDPRVVLDIKMAMMRAGNRLHALRPCYLLVWQEDYVKTGIPAVRSYADEKNICLMLNTAPLLIGDGPPERIVESVMTILREGAGTGRFVLLVNMVPVGTPVEHVHAAIAAVRQFGRYPISPDIDSKVFRMPSFEPFDVWAKKNGLKV
jgi:uroporphyrinogen decarboxylase